MAFYPEEPQEKRKFLLKVTATISFVIFLCNGELEPVTLSSTLKQPSLCPNEASATFVCTTRSLRVHWRVDNRDIVLERARVELGGLHQGIGYIATLLRCTEEEGCISALNILLSNKIEIEVQCYNGSEFTIQTVRYSPRVSDPPSPPDNFMEEILDENTVRLSWSSRSESEFSHYIIQLDSTDPLLIKNSSVNISSGVAHTVQLYAVNKCGQSSNVTTKVIHSSITMPPTTPSTTVTTPTLTSTTPTISSDKTASVVQSTEFTNCVATSTFIVTLCIICLVLLAIAVAYYFLRTKNQKKEEKEPKIPSLSPQPSVQNSPQDSPEHPDGEISSRATKCTHSNSH